MLVQIPQNLYIEKPSPSPLISSATHYPHVSFEVGEVGVVVEPQPLATLSNAVTIPKRPTEHGVIDKTNMFEAGHSKCEKR